MRKKIGFLITARLKSTRLPKKILLPLGGRPAIERIIDRAKAVNGISAVVLCTSTNPQDDPLVEISKRNKIECFRGSEDDVLKRLLDASNLYSLDYFIGITADNPLFSVEWSSRLAKEVESSDYDFIKIDGLPFGTATYAVKITALETVCHVKTIIDTEIWGYLINRPEIFRVKVLNVEGFLRRPEIRMTMDYREDYEFLNHLYSNISFEDILPLDKALSYINRHPEVLSINKHCIQKDLSPEMKVEIDRVYSQKREEIIKIKEEIEKKRG